MPSTAVVILADATNGFRNNIRRMRSASLRDRIRTTSRTRGKENLPPLPLAATTTHSHVDTAPYYLFSSDVPHIVITSASRQVVTNATNDNPRRWDPVNGNIILKVEVPTTGDIWRFKVPENVTLQSFKRKVGLKLGYSVTLSMGSDPCLSPITSEEDFKHWKTTRFDEAGRNVPIKAHEI